MCTLAVCVRGGGGYRLQLVCIYFLKNQNKRNPENQAMQTLHYHFTVTKGCFYKIYVYIKYVT